MNWFLKNRLRLPGTGKGVTLCYAARVGDLAALNRSDLSTLQRNDGNGFAVQRDEFNFVRPPVTVDMHDGADVSRGELVARKSAVSTTRSCSLIVVMSSLYRIHAQR